MTIKKADRIRRAVQSTFKSEHGKECLLHLAEYCMAVRSTFSTDPLEMARLAGRREVWLEIQTNLNLTEEDLINMARQIGDDDE